MRTFALVAGLAALAVGSNGSAMPSPGERVIAEGKIVNVDEKNSSFDVLAADGGRTTHFTPKPVLMVIRIYNDEYYHGTWDDLRTISASGRIVSIAVDPNNPNVVYVGGAR
jgi:hypothetical protein